MDAFNTYTLNTTALNHRTIQTFNFDNIIMCWQGENCEAYEIAHIVFSLNAMHTTYTLIPLIWYENAWHRDELYEDNTSTWTVEEMLNLRDYWEYVHPNS